MPSVAVITVRVDDGLGQNLGVLFRLGPCSQIAWLPSGNVHVSVDQGQQVVAIRAGGVSQVDDRDVIPIALLGNSAIVPSQVAFAVQSQPAHSTGTGIFQVGVEEVGSFADAAGADHQAVDVVAVHQGYGLVLLAFASKHQPLLGRTVLSAAPLLDLEGDVGVGFLDFFGCGPPGGAVLAVTHRSGFDAVEGVVVGEGG